MKKSVFCAVLLLFSAHAQGWSREGHELVATLAEARLSPEARAEVAVLLAGEPVPTLPGVAAWADDIRAESRTGVHELGERSSHWHYLNFPRGVDCAYEPARDCPDGDCVIGAINAQAAILADRTRPLAERRDALKFVVHFVGDVHEPMHAGFGDDRGGNNFQVMYRGRQARGGEGTNLHAVWDRTLLASAGLDRAAYAERLLAVIGDPPLPPSSDNPPRDWALESCRLIVDEKIYPSRHRIGDDYIDHHRPLAERRIRQAGQRLADLLNTALVAPAAH
jgi:hypothetical protein